MRVVFGLMLAFLLLAGCSASSQSQPQITDTGKPGQIKAVVFYDENRNGSRDPGEAGISDRVSISQDISCPSSSKLEDLTQAETDSNGEAVFKELEPGQYCVAYMGSRGSITKLTNLVYLSSEQAIQVFFGLSQN